MADHFDLFLGNRHFTDNGILDAHEATDLATHHAVDAKPTAAKLAISHRPSNGNDIITGTARDDVFDALGGNDQVTGGEGRDLLFGGNGTDKVIGSNGDDVLYGENGKDVVQGGAGNDYLFGGDGNDTLAGGTGDDVLNGGNGNDSATGGTGADVFIASHGADTIKDFVFGDDTLDVSAFGILDFNTFSLLCTDTPAGLKVDFGNGDILTLLGATLQNFASHDSLAFALTDSGGIDSEGVGGATPVAVLGVDPHKFNSTGSKIIIHAVGDTFLDDASLIVATIDGIAIDPSHISLLDGGKYIAITGALHDGLNKLSVNAILTGGDDTASASTNLWAGAFAQNIKVIDSHGHILKHQAVTASLTEDQSVTTHGFTNGKGFVKFIGLPDRGITVQALLGSEFGSLGILGSDAGKILKLVPAKTVSTIDNNDFSQGTDGWNTGSANVTIVDHGSVGFAAALAATDQDLVLNTGGIEGPSSISRTFVADASKNSAEITFKFITSEVPGGYFGTKYNDYYTVTLRDLTTGTVVTQTNSMNGLGLGAFDAGGATDWRTLSVPLTNAAGVGDKLQVEVTVANVADNLLDSQVVVDGIKEQTLSIQSAQLKDIGDNPNLNLGFVSVDSSNPFFGGHTHINGSITIKGDESDSLTSLVLEIHQGGALATADLSSSAAATLIGQQFGKDQKLEITSNQLLFELSNAQAAVLDTSVISSLQLTIKATSSSGQVATKDIGGAQLLSLYDGANRYGDRDASKGGDGWALPSTINFIEAFGNSILVGDFSNMDGGKFVPHKSHDAGLSVDAWFDGYNALNGATASTLLTLLNRPEEAEISAIYVAYTATPGDSFFDAIKNVTLNDGRKATAVIRPDAAHTTHFHFELYA